MRHWVSRRPVAAAMSWAGQPGNQREPVGAPQVWFSDCGGNVLVDADPEPAMRPCRGDDERLAAARRQRPRAGQQRVDDMQATAKPHG